MNWLRILAMGLVVLACIAAFLLTTLLQPRAPSDIFTALPQKGEPIRVTAFGTSLTANYNWPERLAVCPGRPLAVSRVARSGAASGWALGQIAAVAAQRPDVVLIEFGVNDADLRDGLSLRQSAANHRRIIAELRVALPEVRVVLMTMSPAQGLKRLQRPLLTAYYRLYSELANELHTGLLDLYPRWLALPYGDRGLADGLHPTEAAAVAVILPALGNYLGLDC